MLRPKHELLPTDRVGQIIGRGSLDARQKDGGATATQRASRRVDELLLKALLPVISHDQRKELRRR